VIFAVLGGLMCWAFAGWVWPWAGPWLVEPCPQATIYGTKFAFALGAVWGIAKALEFELALRRRALQGRVMTSAQLIAMRRPQ